MGLRLGKLQEEWDEAGGLDVAAIELEAEPGLVMVGQVQGFGIHDGFTIMTRLDPTEQPFLFDHQREGTPLLPGVMGVESFAAVAALAFPDLHVAAIEDVEFLAPFKFYHEEARTMGLRAVNLLRAFNVRVGITREMDRPSARYGSTPVDGPSKGIGIQPHWEDMVTNYYRLLGWDVKTGKPLQKTLKALGIENVIEDIW